MMQLLRATTERVNATAARVVGASSTPCGNMFGGTAATDSTFAWNVNPSVHATAICTHGKRYERRLQEMLT